MIRKLIRLYAIICACILMMSSCTQTKDTTDADAKSIEMQYASLLSLNEGEGYITAEIKNPWDSTKVLHRYILVPKDKELPASLPQGDIVRTPLTHAVYFTSVHASLIDQLGAYSSIAGVCDAEYIYLTKIQDDIKSKKIVDCGNSMTPNIERIIDLMPDAMLISPFENSGSYGKVGSLGIPIIECADYMETSPLGRAEWMRFYGLLTGTEQKADSLFTATEKAYNDMKALAMDAKTRPTVFMDMKYGASWYISGGNSTTGQMLQDAGADYIFKSEKSAGSVPYDPEVVFDHAQNANLWLIKYNQASKMTYAQLSKEWSNYARLAAYTNHNVYGCNLQNSSFYEELPFHPDLLLRDYIIIFHPELMEDKTLRYFEHLEK